MCVLLHVCVLQQYYYFQLMDRLPLPEEVAKTCLYLATDATFTTGQNLLISGGEEVDYGFKRNMEWFFQGN